MRDPRCHPVHEEFVLSPYMDIDATMDRIETWFILFAISTQVYVVFVQYLTLFKKEDLLTMGKLSFVPIDNIKSVK